MKRPILVALTDFFTQADREKKPLNKKRYIRLALMCGWFCGGHRFYGGQWLLGIIYTLLCWTGIPFAMTMIDLMIVLPMKADEEGNLTL